MVEIESEEHYNQKTRTVKQSVSSFHIECYYVKTFYNCLLLFLMWHLNTTFEIFS